MQYQLCVDHVTISWRRTW